MHMGLGLAGSVTARRPGEPGEPAGGGDPLGRLRNALACGCDRSERGAWSELEHGQWDNVMD